MTAGRTNHYGLSKMSQGDNFNADGYKHVNADRDALDALAYVGATGHHHTGATASDFKPVLGPNLSLDESGMLVAGRRVYYKITYVDDRGIESAASPEVYVDTPAAVPEPGPASLAVDTAGGTLTGGVYFYVLSAYAGSNTEETRATAPNSVSLSGSTNAVTLTLPTLPTGADGFNIFRRGPGDVNYRYVASTTASSYIDDGSVTPSSTRSVSRTNVTNNANAVVVTLNGASPTIPDGYTWKIYRTMVHGGWDNSLLVHVLEEDAVTYTDVGLNTQPGRYPEATMLIDDAEPIVLGDEVEGVLALGHVVYPVVIEFRWPDDPLVEGDSTDGFVCEYPHVTIVAARASLGCGSTPATQDVTFDTFFGTGATPTYDVSIFDSATPPYPTVPVGIQRGERVLLSVPFTLDEGDSLCSEMTQVGGGATPTDKWATLTLYGVAWGFPDDVAWNDVTGAGLIP